MWNKLASHSRFRRFSERHVEADVIAEVSKKLRDSLDVFIVSHLIAVCYSWSFSSTHSLGQRSGDVEREMMGGKTLSEIKDADQTVNAVVNVCIYKYSYLPQLLTKIKS